MTGTEIAAQCDDLMAVRLLLRVVLGETGRQLSPVKPWAWIAFVVGLLLCVVHIVIAFAHAHGWSHAAAVGATARQTEAVYGLAWGGGIFVNYVFVAAWAADAWSWRARGPMEAVLRWPRRIFYAVVVFNAAVIFAAGFRRVLGLAIVLWLLWLWLHPRNASNFESVRL